MLKHTEQGGSDRHALHGVLVTRCDAVFDAVLEALSSHGVTIRWERSPEQAVTTAKAERCPVLLVTAECDWLYIVQAFGAAPDAPNVIVLLPQFEPGLWVQGYRAGAFDVLPLHVEGEKLRNTLIAAHRSWERRQVVTAARARNPMSSVVPG